MTIFDTIDNGENVYGLCLCVDKTYKEFLGKDILQGMKILTSSDLIISWNLKEKYRLLADFSSKQIKTDKDILQHILKRTKNRNIDLYKAVNYTYNIHIDEIIKANPVTKSYHYSDILSNYKENRLFECFKVMHGVLAIYYTVYNSIMEDQYFDTIVNINGVNEYKSVKIDINAVEKY